MKITRIKKEVRTMYIVNLDNGMEYERTPNGSWFYWSSNATLEPVILNGVLEEMFQESIKKIETKSFLKRIGWMKLFT